MTDLHHAEEKIDAILNQLNGDDDYMGVTSESSLDDLLQAVSKQMTALCHNTVRIVLGEKFEGDADKFEMDAAEKVKRLYGERDAARVRLAEVEAEISEYRAHFGSVAHGREAFEKNRAEAVHLRTMLAASDAAHARALDDEKARTLFAEGERDAARNDVEEAQGHHRAADAAHQEAEADLARVKADFDGVKALCAQAQDDLARVKAEAEGLRAILREGEFLVGFAEHLARDLDPSRVVVEKFREYAAKHRAALASPTPAPTLREIRESTEIGRVHQAIADGTDISGPSGA